MSKPTSMRYVSTRGRAPELGFADVLLAGLAPDGGLYVPVEWPSLPAALPMGSYQGLAAAARIEARFVQHCLGVAERADADGVRTDERQPRHRDLRHQRGPRGLGDDFEGAAIERDQIGRAHV